MVNSRERVAVVRVSRQVRRGEKRHLLGHGQHSGGACGSALGGTQDLSVAVGRDVPGGQVGETAEGVAVRQGVADNHGGG